MNIHPVRQLDELLFPVVEAKPEIPSDPLDMIQFLVERRLEGVVGARVVMGDVEERLVRGDRQAFHDEALHHREGFEVLGREMVVHLRHQISKLVVGEGAIRFDIVLPRRGHEPGAVLCLHLGEFSQ